MAAVCEMCGKIWQGVTLGKMFHCRPRKALKRKKKHVEEKRCECGEIATTFSAVTSHLAKVCQRCHDCEKKNQRNFSNGSDCNSATYAVRMPRWGKEF